MSGDSQVFGHGAGEAELSSLSDATTSPHPQPARCGSVQPHHKAFETYGNGSGKTHRQAVRSRDGDLMAIIIEDWAETRLHLHLDEL